MPAEEQDGGKINMINAGAYKPMDVCCMLHPAPYNTIGSSLAIAECVVEYTGHTAHAAGKLIPSQLLRHHADLFLKRHPGRQ